MINQQLTDFIKLQLQQGVMREQIINELSANGWTQGDIEEGFSAIRMSAPAPTPASIPTPTPEPVLTSTLNPNLYPYHDNNPTISPTKTHSGKKLFFVILILFLSVGGASAYYFKDNLVNLPIIGNLFASKEAVAPENPAETPTEPIPKTDIVDKGKLSGESVIDCGTDYNCFIAASRNCEPAQMKNTISMDLFGSGSIQTIRSQLEINGIKNSQCKFSSRTEDIQTTFSVEALAKAKTQGMSQAEIDAVLRDSNEIAKTLIGLQNDCLFSVSDLTGLLIRWQVGSFATEDLSAKHCQLSMSNPSGQQPGTSSGSTALSSENVTETTILSPGSFSHGDYMINITALSLQEAEFSCTARDNKNLKFRLRLNQTGECFGDKILLQKIISSDLSGEYRVTIKYIN